MTSLIFTDVIFTFAGSIISNVVAKSRTHLQLAMRNFVKQKHLIEEFYHYCITTTYDEYCQFKGWWKKKKGKKRKKCWNAVSKKELIWSESNSGKLIQTVRDNSDAKLSTQNGLKQTHNITLILTQESLSNTIDWLWSGTKIE